MIMEVIVAIFGAVSSILGTMVVMYFRGMSINMKSMDDSMTKLNIKIEKVIVDQSWHKEEIIEVKSRIAHLEQLEQ